MEGAYRFFIPNSLFVIRLGQSSAEIPLTLAPFKGRFVNAEWRRKNYELPITNYESWTPFLFCKSQLVICNSLVVLWFIHERFHPFDDVTPREVVHTTGPAGHFGNAGSYGR